MVGCFNQDANNTHTLVRSHSIFVDSSTHLFNFNFCNLFVEETDYFSGSYSHCVGFTDCILAV